MIEMLLGKDIDGSAHSFDIAPGISFPNANEAAATKSPGTSKSGTTYNMAGGSAVDYLRLPGAGTIEIAQTPPDIEIGIDFLLRNFPTTYHTLWARYRQGASPAGWQLVCNPNGRCVFQGDDQRAWATGFLKLNTRHKMFVRRIAGVWELYLDDVLQATLDYKASQLIPHDWTFGTYLNASNMPIGPGPVASPVNWSMYGFIARQIT